MNADRWRRIEELYHAAVDLDQAGRAELLDAACAEDEVLRAEVEALLAAHECAGTFLARPALEGAAHAATRSRAAGGETAGVDQDLITTLGSAPPVPPRSDALIGELLDGKYRITRLLGKGGMGAVFRATHVELDRDVAIKVLRTAAVSDDSGAIRFKREALAVARLKHPNIVTVYDFDAAPGSGAYLVMELLEGRSLRGEISERGPLPTSETVAIAVQVLSAVDAAHRAGVIHRDLKPENIFLENTPVGRVAKVLDFGIAKLSEAPAGPLGRTTEAGVVLGTPMYMPPEQWRGDDPDARSDVYAFGCVVYEMLTGAPPFRADRAAVLLYMHLDEAPEPPSASNPDVAPAIDAIVLRALAKAPGDRFASAAEFAAALVEASRSAEELETMRFGASDSATRTGFVAAPPPNNLPLEATRFVGRWGQVAEVRRLLSTTRLLTLTGPGGIGKTRLAAQVAKEVLDDFPEGAWLVKLAAIGDRSRVADAIASAAKLREEGSAHALEALVRAVGKRRMLVVLDNCEHLVAECARVADELMRGCPHLQLLATSREPLVIPGETVWSVPPLTLPTADEHGALGALLESEAAQLFLERAASAKPGFELDEASAPALLELLGHLDGIPLAIELAAARVRALTLEQMVAKLGDLMRLLTGGSRTAPPKQQTLRAAVDWSHALLTEAERVLFRRLSVFAGGWTLEAAEGICAGGPIDSEDIMDLVARLVDRSLVIASDGADGQRYRMLEVIRQYAAARLGDAGEVERLRAAHRAWFLALLEDIQDEFLGARQAEWIARLDHDLNNLRSALDWSEPGEHPDLHIRFCLALGRYWFFGGHWREGRGRIERLVASHGDHIDDAKRATALFWAGNFALFQGDFGAAHAMAEEGLLLSRRLGESRELALALHLRASVLFRLARPEEAAGAAEESLEISRSTGDRSGVGMASNLLGMIATHLGDFARAERWYRAALGIYRELGRTEAIAGMLYNLGDAVLNQGDTGAARRFYEESLAIQTGLPVRQVNQFTAQALGMMALYEGSLHEAERQFRRSMAIAHELGDKRQREASLARLALVAGLEGREADALELLREALGVDAVRANKESLTLFLDALAAAAAIDGDPERALRLAGAATRARDDIRLVLPGHQREFLARLVAPARRALGPAAADAAFETGRAMTLDEALALALGD